MFVIPCKFSQRHNYIVPLLGQIRQYHPDEKIVVVDSASEDKSYFRLLEPFNVTVMDVNNRNFDVGAYWRAFKRFPDEPFYYFLHDSTKVKGSLESFKERDLTTLAYFGIPADGGFVTKIADIESKTKYKWKPYHGVYGPMFFLKGNLMRTLYEKGLHNILATCKIECGATEACFGLAFEQEGYSMPECALYGDILVLESEGGKSGPIPHKTDWQFPIEKFYGAHQGRV